MNLRFLLTFFFLSLLCAVATAQINRANHFYDNYQYTKAIPLYLKATEGKHQKEALEKLASCYRLTKQYLLAEKYYAMLMILDSVSPANHLYYGEVLLNNSRHEAAQEQFSIYSKKVTSDKRGEIFLKSCILTKLSLLKKQQYDVYNVSEINSEAADFSPAYYKKGIVFVSERRKDLINEATYGWTGRPYLTLFYTEKGSKKDSGVFVSTGRLPYRINKGLHNGPASFSSDQNTMFFTRVENITSGKVRDVVNRPQIFSALYKNGWGDIKPFEYNSRDYSLAHPALAPDGQTLFFSSDMPGGSGGKDLWMCKLENNTWGKPMNLGPDVNTPGNDLFPYVRKDGTLYFASDGHVGFGGLDIYSARFIGNKYTQVTHLEAPVNSATDDFSIVFGDDLRSGYFSSNRGGGKGDDDIYRFVMKAPEVRVNRIAGKIMLNELDPASNMEVKLVDSKGTTIQKLMTDSAGNFVFEKLNPDETYLVMLDASDTRLNVNDKNSKVYGKIIYNDSLPAPNVRLVITSTGNKVVKEFLTNEKGYFKFTTLASDAAGLNTLDASDPKLAARKNVTIVGKVVLEDGKTAAGIEIILADKDGNPIRRVIADADGKFRFENLPTDQNYMLLVDEKDTRLSGAKKHTVLGKLLLNGQPDDPSINVTVTLGGKDGAVLKSISTDKEGFFRFESLSTDYNKLALVDEKNTSLNVNIKEGMFVENIYYDYGKWDLRPEAKVQLDKVASILKSNPGLKVELSSHTDSRASDQYNLSLSQKRAKAAVEYIVSKGGDASRITGMGLGESKLMNRCSNGVSCSEEEHQQNRRTEIKVRK